MARTDKYFVLEEVEGKRVVTANGTRKRIQRFNSSIILNGEMTDAKIKAAIASGVPIEGHFGSHKEEDMKSLKEYQQRIAKRQNTITGKNFKRTTLVAVNGGDLTPATGKVVEKKVEVIKEVGLSKSVIVELMNAFKAKAAVLMAAETVEDVTAFKGWEKAAGILGVKVSPEAVLEALKD